MKKCLILLLVSLLSACSSMYGTGNVATEIDGLSTSLTSKEDQLLYYLLHKEFIDWQGTPYQLGGDSKKGIDCSALVKNIYHDSLNITLPRTTEAQAKQGDFVYLDQLKVGDLVFFKTGWRTNHVGIYMGEGQFIHASTSKGVMSSSLSNVYWDKKYWQSRRYIE